MEWRDTGILLTVRPHGETSVIIEILTAEHGRHAGIIRGGASRKLRPVLQPGAQLGVIWQARLESHLGAFRAEPEMSRSVDLMQSRLCLEAANSVFSLLSVCLPEREPVAYLYARTKALLDHVADDLNWLANYVQWEIALLREVGFGLDLETCAATGSRDDLVYVSPRSGRAVSRGAGAPYHDRLLKLPAFLRDNFEPAEPGSIAEGLALTGYFLKNFTAPALGKVGLPPARARLVELLDQRRRQSEG